MRLVWIGFIAMIAGYEWLLWFISPLPLIVPIVMNVIIVAAGFFFWRRWFRPGER